MRLAQPVCFALLLALTALSGACRPAAGDATLRLLCSAGLHSAVDELVGAFSEESGIAIEPDYAGSGLILSKAREDAEVDLFLPGDTFYVDELQKLTGRVAERTDIAYLVPCLVVAGGNPKKILSLQDVARPEVRLALGNPETCQIGRVSASLLQSAGVAAVLAQAKQGLTVNELGLWVKTGDVDVALVWDATAAALGPTVEVIALPASTEASRVTVALLSAGPRAESARQFMRFCTEARAQGILSRLGFRTTPPAAGPLAGSGAEG